MKRTRQTNADGPTRARKRQTAVYIPTDLETRLARYMLAKHPGRLNVRSLIIVDAIRDKLTKEGF